MSRKRAIVPPPGTSDGPQSNKSVRWRLNGGIVNCCLLARRAGGYRPQDSPRSGRASLPPAPPPESPMPIEYEPFSARWREDPYPTYRELRERAPLHFAAESDCFCLSRHEDVLFALNHPEIFSSRAMFTVIFNNGFEGAPPLTWGTIKFLVRFALATRANPLGFQNARNLIASDPPEHGDLRAIVNRGFTPRRIQAWEPRIREIAAERAAPLARGEPFDLVGDFAIPLPVTIIAEML